MVQDPLLGLTKTDIGAMTSAFPAAYGKHQQHTTFFSLPGQSHMPQCTDLE